MRLVDAEALKTKAFGKRGGLIHTSDIDAMPTVDAVEVVRCRDCKHYQFADNRAFGFPVKRCEWSGFEDVDDYDYCSRAERKEGDHAKGTV